MPARERVLALPAVGALRRARRERDRARPRRARGARRVRVHRVPRRLDDEARLRGRALRRRARRAPAEEGRFAGGRAAGRPPRRVQSHAARPRAVRRAVVDRRAPRGRRARRGQRHGDGAVLQNRPARSGAQPERAARRRRVARGPRDFRAERGLHLHAPAPARLETLRALLVGQIAPWFARNVAHLALWRETYPQHFRGSSGGGGSGRFDDKGWDYKDSVEAARWSGCLSQSSGAQEPPASPIFSTSSAFPRSRRAISSAAEARCTGPAETARAIATRRACSGRSLIACTRQMGRVRRGGVVLALNKAGVPRVETCPMGGVVPCFALAGNDYNLTPARTPVVPAVFWRAVDAADFDAESSR